MSKIYKILLGWFTEEERVKVQMIRWADNFKKTIPFETWAYFWKHTWKISVCTRRRENSLKMMYRWYMTSEKIALMSNSKLSDKC